MFLLNQIYASYDISLFTLAHKILFLSIVNFVICNMIICNMNYFIEFYIDTEFFRYTNKYTINI